MISSRLLQIAMLIDKGKVVFDVGSDHALLPCFLVENNISPKVYAGDVSLGPLQNASETIEKHGLQEQVIPVFSDGLKLAPSDVDVVVIAGMGYYTIEHILDEADVSRYQYFVVQSNSDVELLRQYISDHGYTIEDERIVFDSFYYQIIKFSADLHEPYTPLEIKYGPILLKRQDEVFLAYLSDRLNKLKEINIKAKKADIELTIKEIEQILYN